MNAITFDTLAVSKRLQSTGVQQEQAEALAREFHAISQADMSHLATKGEFKEFRSEWRADLSALELRLHQFILKIAAALGALIVASASFLAAIKFLEH